MANDILGLGDDASHAPEVQPTTEPLKPRAVPELDESMAMALSFNGSPMAPDFFTSSRSKPKKRLRKFSR